MIRQLILTVLFLSLFVVFVALLGYVDNRKLFLTSTPTSNNEGEHGLSQLKKLITNAGGKIRIIDRDYRTLKPGHATSGSKNNVLFLSLPAAIPANQQELEYLASWVSMGNHIVAMLALDDTPHWLNKQNRLSVDEFLSAFKLQLSRIDSSIEVEAPTQKQPYLITQLGHPVTKNIKRIKTSMTSQDYVWQLRGQSSPQSSLILLREETSLSPVAWLSLFGKGKLYIFSHSDLFANINIEKPDNMQLAKNILDYSLENSSSIYFDDVHHIASVTTRSSIPLLHPQALLVSLLFVSSLLAYLLNRPNQQNRKNSTSLSQFVKNKGNQLPRKLSKADTAIQYATIFFNRARSQLDLATNNQPVWEELKHRKLNKRLLRKAQKSYQNVLAAKRFNLNKFIHRLEKLRSQIK